MKTILLTTVLAFSTSLFCFCQKHLVLINEGDSLFKVKSYDLSLTKFEEAIDIATKSKTTISEDVWVRMFMGAGNSADATFNGSKARKYWNLATGDKGERLLDKVNYLREYGIKPIKITMSTFSGTVPSYYKACTSSATSYLIWVDISGVFVQKFDDCNSYPPFKFKDSVISSLIKNKFDNIKNETIENANNHGNEAPTYEIVVYSLNSYVTKIIKILDLRDPRELKPHDLRISLQTSINNFNNNISTDLSKLLTAGNERIVEYETKLTSANERLKIGKL